MTRYFEFRNDTSDKFWEIRLDRKTVSLRWGKRGTNGQSKDKSFDHEDDAKKEFEKMISSKIREGYEEKNTAADAGDDYARLQGLWKLKSCIARGGEVISSVTHLLFEGRKIKRIDPDEVDGGNWDSFVLDEKASPKRFTLTSEWAGKGGQVNRRVDRWLYEVTDDTLKLCWPNIFGDFPDVLSDTEHGVETFTRDAGPLPETKKASGRRPVDLPYPGTFTWDDNYEWWETELKSGKRIVSISISPENPDDDISRYSGLIKWIMKNTKEIGEYAASELLENHNENWNDGKPITSAKFVSKLGLDSIHIDPDGISVYFDDGDLFYGHCIIVSIDHNNNFTGADIAG
ncbi:MAG TPA: DUF2262 domain-containing protein [Spirochaetota bacterium]|nr:DUF2262 domain-containing protein [Spirochaetota bacterium]